MRGARSIIGLPVLDLVSGKRLGTVRDILVDRAWHVRGFVLEYASWFNSARVVEWANVRTIGHDSVLIDSKTSVRKYRDRPGFSFLCFGSRRLRGLPLISSEGIQMGHLEDVYFSSKMEDSIIGFELSDGLLNDMQAGRRTIPLPAGADRGEDVIWIPLPSAESLEWKSN